MKTIHALVAALALTALIGCASTPAARSKREPGTIALRNSTGRSLKSVRIREDGDSAGSNRLGQVSPVLPDVTYSFVRSPKAPALPSRLRVSWNDASDREQSAVVEIGDQLKQASGAEGETLLFDIGGGGIVSARVVTAER